MSNRGVFVELDTFRKIEFALANCYNVVEWPADGESDQDKALKLVRDSLKEVVMSNLQARFKEELRALIKQYQLDATTECADWVLAELVIDILAAANAAKRKELAARSLGITSESPFTTDPLENTTFLIFAANRNQAYEWVESQPELRYVIIARWETIRSIKDKTRQYEPVLLEGWNELPHLTKAMAYLETIRGPDKTLL